MYAANIHNNNIIYNFVNSGHFKTTITILYIVEK